MTESERLPPTPGALRQHILRAHVQDTIWGQATVPQQEQLDPLKNGYHRDTHDGNLKPITTDVPPAPEAIVEMVRCQCKGNCSSNRCSCQSANLPCTDLCLVTVCAKMMLICIMAYGIQMTTVTIQTNFG